MAILKIARMGHPVLQEVAAKVSDPTSADTASVVRDMLETLEDSGGLGLAAPRFISQSELWFFLCLQGAPVMERLTVRSL